MANLAAMKERLLREVDIIPDFCWNWTGPCGSHGYGQITFESKGYLVHRVMYEACNGPIPPGMFVCHRCDNRRCINPAHLFIGSPKDNIHDMINKGRDCLDSNLKLLDSEVVEIRFQLSQGHRQRDIAKIFGISQATVSRINNRHSYDWVE